MFEFRSILAAVVFAGATSVAVAVPVTLVGTNIVVTYDDSTLGLFGAPTISGDSLSWAPASFAAVVNRTGAGVGVNNATSTFAFTVTAMPGWFLNTASLVSESGSFSKSGANAAVFVFGDLKATPLPGTSVFTSTIGAPTFTPGLTGTWTASAPVINLAPGTTESLISYRDQLVARVVGTGSASVSKTAATINIAVTPVPEPSAYMMMLAGGAFVGFVAWRRRQRT